MMDRACKVCGAIKSTSDFYSSYRSVCKPCVRSRSKRRNRTNPTVQAYDRERAKRPSVRARIVANSRRWRAENPLAYKAQTAVGNAVRDGKLTRQPCEACGETRAHAHHDDYARPLEVRWLCALHHQRHHADTGVEGANKRPKEDAE